MSIIPQETCTTTLRVSDFDRNLTIPTCTLLRLAMEARWRSTILQRVKAWAPEKRIMIKAQVVRRIEPVVSRLSLDHVHMPVVITQIPHALSRSSFTLQYDMRLEQTGPMFAQAMVVVIFVDVSGPAPRSVPLPPFMHTDITWVMPPSAASPDLQVALPPTTPTDLALASDVLTRVINSPQILAEARILPHNVLPRFSDEDLNHHINQAAYASFFSDALASVGLEDIPEVMYIEYITEVHQGEKCTVSIVQNDAKSLVLFLIKQNHTTTPAARAYCSWSSMSQEIVATSFGASRA